MESFPFHTNRDEKLGRAWLGFVDASFVLALSFRHGDLEPECVVVSTRGGVSKKREVESAADASGRLTSFNVEGRGSRTLLRSSWRVHRCCGRSAFVVDNLTV